LFAVLVRIVCARRLIRKVRGEMRGAGGRVSIVAIGACALLIGCVGLAISEAGSGG
jgi:hypothetical protein